MCGAPLSLELPLAELPLPHPLLAASSHFLCEAVTAEDACALFVCAGASGPNDATDGGRGTLPVPLLCKYVAQQMNER